MSKTLHNELYDLLSSTVHGFYDGNTDGVIDKIEQAFLSAVERAKPGRSIANPDVNWFEQDARARNNALDEYHDNLVKEITGK